MRKIAKIGNPLCMVKFHHERAKELIEEQGRVRRWIAAKLDLTPGTFKMYLNGNGRPARLKVEKLADILGVPVSELLELDESAGTGPPRRLAAGQ